MDKRHAQAHVRARLDRILDSDSVLVRKDVLRALLEPDRTEANNWTVADWEKWSNDLAEMMPPDLDGDEDQETLIEQCVAGAAEADDQLRAVAAELHRRESETRLTDRGREHAERLHDILDGERS